MGGYAKKKKKTLKTIPMPKRHVLGWHILFPFRAHKELSLQHTHICDTDVCITETTEIHRDVQ